MTISLVCERCGRAILYHDFGKRCPTDGGETTGFRLMSSHARDDVPPSQRFPLPPREEKP